MFVKLHLSLSEGASKIYAIRDQTVDVQVGGNNVVGALSSGLLAACVGEKRTIISSNEEGHELVRVSPQDTVSWDLPKNTHAC